MASLAEQLEAMLREWGAAVHREASDSMLATGQAMAPVAPEDGGETRDSGMVVPHSDTSATLTFEDRGFTDEGPEPHTITGNPYLAFEGLGGELVILGREGSPASVNWVPGPGVEANRGWFTERTATDDHWGEALRVAADTVSFG